MTDDQTAAVFDHDGPWTEEEYLALGETPQRVELFDGSLHVTPAPTPRHQAHLRESGRPYWNPAARAVGLQLLEAVNVRLRPGTRIPIPDLVITGPEWISTCPTVEAAEVQLVCEIISPSNASTDKVLKMHYYAAAGIEWYLLVEQESRRATPLPAAGHATTQSSSATRTGEVLRATEPVKATIRPEELVP